MDEIEAAFEADLCSASLPKDWNLVRVYADYLEERCKTNDLKRSATMRWMANKKMWPDRRKRSHVNSNSEYLCNLKSDVIFSWWFVSGPEHAHLYRFFRNEDIKAAGLSNVDAIRYYDTLAETVLVLHKILTATNKLNHSPI